MPWDFVGLSYCGGAGIGFSQAEATNPGTKNLEFTKGGKLQAESVSKLQEVS